MNNLDHWTSWEVLPKPRASGPWYSLNTQDYPFHVLVWVYFSSTFFLFRVSVEKPGWMRQLSSLHWWLWACSQNSAFDLKTTTSWNMPSATLLPVPVPAPVTTPASSPLWDSVLALILGESYLFPGFSYPLWSGGWKSHPRLAWQKEPTAMRNWHCVVQFCATVWVLAQRFKCGTWAQGLIQGGRAWMPAAYTT